MDINGVAQGNLKNITITMPTFCCFTLCDECILHCQMCHKWQKDIFIKPEREKMTFSDWKICALSLKEFAPENFVINFGGGEVTTIPWLFDLVSFCHNLKFKTNIATNGFLIDETLVKKMGDSGLDFINISLDSLDEKTHNRLRGSNGVYAKVMNAIELIHKYSKNTKISICSIIMEQTIDGIVELVEWAQKNEKISMIYLMAVMQPNNTLPEPFWHRKEFSYLWPEDYSKVEIVLNKLTNLKKKGYKISNQAEHIQAFKIYFKDPREYVKTSTCNIDRAIHISSVGDLFMCYRHEKLGDVRDKFLKELWSSDLATQVREKIRSCRENCHFLLNCNFEL